MDPWTPRSITNMQQFKNTQTGNVFVLICTGDNVTIFRENCGDDKFVFASIDPDGEYFATLFDREERQVRASVAGHCCLDDALSELEEATNGAWFAPQTIGL